jgi:hypothetical protein
MQILGGEDNGKDLNQEKLQNELGDDVDISKKRQIVWELMQTEEGKKFLAEACAKNCYSELIERLDVVLSDKQIKLFKMDILSKCSHIINSTPSFFLTDISECRKILDDQVSTRLGLLVEELEFKYSILFDDK